MYRQKCIVYIIRILKLFVHVLMKIIVRRQWRIYTILQWRHSQPYSVHFFRVSKLDTCCQSSIFLGVQLKKIGKFDRVSARQHFYYQTITETCKINIFSQKFANIFLILVLQCLRPCAKLKATYKWNFKNRVFFNNVAEHEKCPIFSRKNHPTLLFKIASRLTTRRPKLLPGKTKLVGQE